MRIHRAQVDDTPPPETSYAAACLNGSGLLRAHDFDNVPHAERGAAHVDLIEAVEFGDFEGLEGLPFVVDLRFGVELVLRYPFLSFFFSFFLFSFFLSFFFDLIYRIRDGDWIMQTDLPQHYSHYNQSFQTSPTIPGPYVLRYLHPQY